MISAFMSEFLIHPAPIEYSGNTCTHNCGYCFSNIRSDKRYSDMPQTMRLLTGASESKGILSFLFNHGYPICMCNRSDPFSRSNIADTNAVLKIAAKIPNGIFFQTKGGCGVYDSLEIIKDKKNVVMYITITTCDDGISQRMEPGAPLLSERIRLAEFSVKMGWDVIIAINPCVEKWMPETRLIELEDRMKSIGVVKFIFQKLKMNRKDINSFSKFRIGQFEKDELDKACAAKDTYFQTQVERQISKGLMPLAFGMPYRTRFFDSVNATLGKAMYGNYAFFDSCFERGNGVFTFSDYSSAIIGDNTELLSFRGKEMSKYIMAQHRGVWKSPKCQAARTFIDVLRIIWNEKRLSSSPQNNFLFQAVTENGVRCVDDDGNILLHFDGGKINREQRTKERG